MEPVDAPRPHIPRILQQRETPFPLAAGGHDLHPEGPHHVPLRHHRAAERHTATLATRSDNRTTRHATELTEQST